MRFLLLSLIVTVSGCSSVPIQESGLAEVHAGMDKGQVVELAGGPQRKYRENSQDHWIYDYFSSDNDHVQRELTFSNGIVTSVGPVHEKKPFPMEKGSEESDDLEHFEKKFQQEQQEENPKGEFKDID